LPIGSSSSQRLDNKSRMTREGHVRLCESVGVRFPRATRPYVKIKGEWADLYRAVLRSVPSKWWQHQG